MALTMMFVMVIFAIAIKRMIADRLKQIEDRIADLAGEVEEIEHERSKRTESREPAEPGAT